MIKQHCIVNDEFNIRVYSELDAEGKTIYSEVYDYYPNNVIEKITTSTGEVIDFDTDGKRKRKIILVQPGIYREHIELQEEVIWEL